MAYTISNDGDITEVYTSDEYIVILVPQGNRRSYARADGWTVRSAYKDFARTQRVYSRPLPYTRTTFTILNQDF